MSRVSAVLMALSLFHGPVAAKEPDCHSITNRSQIPNYRIPYLLRFVPRCNHPRWWKPTDEQLHDELASNRRWVSLNASSFHNAPIFEGEKPQGPVHFIVSANSHPARLCNAQLSWASLRHADLDAANLQRAQLDHADLSAVDFDDAKLDWAYLASANMSDDKLVNTSLFSATLIDANLQRAFGRRTLLACTFLARAKLQHSDLADGQFWDADFGAANLQSADLSDADLNGATLNGAYLSGTHLVGAQLNGAHLNGAHLNSADLNGAHLNGAYLVGSDLSGAHISGANLGEAVYAPSSKPPDAYVARIGGLSTLTAPNGDVVGLVQLRKLLEDAGLDDAADEATYSIQRAITAEKLSEPPWTFPRLEGIGRFVLLDLTTRYGLEPTRALLLIIGLGGILTFVYIWPMKAPKHPKNPSGIETKPSVIRGRGKTLWSGFWAQCKTVWAHGRIYQVFPADRIDEKSRVPTLEKEAKPERVQAESWWKAFRHAAYFSLLAAVNIGFEQFTPGDWIRRIQSQDYTLEAVGWVRVVAGIQSILSVYLLAMWVLTQFGRPFG